ncbi:MAG: 4Fe-4S dicluster domain-containing protein [Candidatus Cloacimonetes bacterium]|nr:4Fe-4S dicluster domain-containing protein [Candidatus Cloacimonadota bacterium]
MNTAENESYSPKKGAMISIKKSIRETILSFFKEALEKKIFDAVLIPVKVPAGDSYTWILIEDVSLFKDAAPIAPIMPVQGANALSSLTRKGKGNLKIAAIMRPCEIRAAIELAKLEQVHLENVSLFSFDCPGALPLSDYVQNPKKGEEIFESFFTENKWNEKSIKPICRMCDNFSLPNCDLHFGILGVEKNSILLIPNSFKGEGVLNEMGITFKNDLSEWKKKVDEIKKEKEKIKKETYHNIQPMVEGLDNLVQTFAKCIGCHNCMSVCPICYCRQCYFDSEISKFTSDNYLLRAEKRGAIRFPTDIILFHTGRMSHMSLSCVSCGMCEDVCPASIPVAQIFSYVADKTQKAFEYQPGRDTGEPLPLKEYKEEELQELKKLVNDSVIQE